MDRNTQNNTPESWTTPRLLYLILHRPYCLQYEPFCLDTHYPPAPKTVESIPSQGVIMAQLLFVGLSMPRLWGRLQKATRTQCVQEQCHTFVIVWAWVYGCVGLYFLACTAVTFKRKRWLNYCVFKLVFILWHRALECNVIWDIE